MARCKHDDVTLAETFGGVAVHECNNCDARLEQIEVSKGVWEMKKITRARDRQLGRRQLVIAVALDDAVAAFNGNHGSAEELINDMRLTDVGDDYDAITDAAEILEHEANKAAETYKGWLLAQVDSRINNPVWKEYHDEAEHQEGVQYWLTFADADKLLEDFKMYVKNRDDDSASDPRV